MSAPESLRETRRWLRFASEDIRLAETLLRQESGAPRHIGWLAQQAAEKAIKAVPVFPQIDFPKSHDLDALRILLPDGWGIKSVYPDLADLTEWAVEARYPSDWPEAALPEAREAVEKARGMLNAAADELRGHGFVFDDGQ
jgi:HEPN domain-containing protein